ncbi:hypothetical protein Nepgr_023600 [Nepenthes gracilis]|uniref:Aluminum-activated malate transporter n=1 Tax=Nepenthes gracilis TaxID=150966 RepID=A0AAD3T2F1_NEPGR|nr:hypothetical protein Nepgr_023600 [Nepenthes gracilis]
MVNKEKSRGSGWQINMPKGTRQVAENESQHVQRTSSRLRNFVSASWKMGVDEPKKFIHGLKVGLALSIVSLFYYVRPLYDGVGSNAMWAILTVVVVFEYTVGATLYKSVNRVMATAVAGSLGVGIHWVASQSGEKFEPIIVGTSVFIFAAATAFSRFIPTVKARFDYGASVFILTFSLISISGYRVEKLLTMAHQRVSRIAIGTSFCVLTSMLFFPVWAGDQLHKQTIKNLENLAISLNGCMAEYFKNDEEIPVMNEGIKEKMQCYNSVLNSKEKEESMANFARWEPTHGNFTFRYPWKQYLKIGEAARSCAYCIDSINGCINSEMQAPEFLKKRIREECMRLSSHSSEVLKELATMIRTMRKSPKIDLSVKDMSVAVQELHDALNSLPTNFLRLRSLPPIAEDHPDSHQEEAERSAKASIIEILPLAALANMLTETVTRIEVTVDAVNKLASMARFKTNSDKKNKQKQQSNKILQRM